METENLNIQRIINKIIDRPTIQSLVEDDRIFLTPPSFWGIENVLRGVLRDVGNSLHNTKREDFMDWD